MTLTDKMQSLINGIETKKNETTTIKFQDDRKLWELKDELKKAGYEQTANAYWCHIFEKEGHKVILNREDEVVEPIEESKAGDANLTKLEIQVLNEMANRSGWGEYILEERSQYLSMLDITVPMRRLRGVLSSLIKKGYIEMWQDEDVPGETVVYVTDKFIEYHSKKTKEQKQVETFCRFELRGTDEYSYEDTDAELVENDIDIYNSSLIEKLEEKFGDRLEHLEYYRYTVSNITDDEECVLTDMFEEVEGDLEHCYISYDFEEKEVM